MTPRKKPSKEYSRMFSALAGGAALVVTGAMGYNISHMSGVFQGGRWVDGPIWWQLGLGAALLLLGVYWARRLPEPGPLPRARAQILKYVGRGKTSGAARSRT